MSEKLWHLKTSEIFERLAPEDLRRVESVSRARSFSRGSPVYLPAEPAKSVFLLAKGRIKICHLTADGKQSILAFVSPGELFGELALLDEEAREDYAETIEASTVVMIPSDFIRDMMEQRPDLSLGVTKMIGLRRKRIERRLRNLLFLSNRERLTHLLLELAEQYGVQGREGIRIGIKLSHQDLANVIGSTRETVTVVLGELQAEKLLTVGRRKIVLVDAERLAASVSAPVPEVSSPDPVATSQGL